MKKVAYICDNKTNKHRAIMTNATPTTYNEMYIKGNQFFVTYTKGAHYTSRPYCLHWNGLAKVGL